MNIIQTQQHQYTLKNTSAGFSLIEVLVSLSIFAVVMTIAVGSLMVLIASNSRAQNMQSVMTNISYALDSLTREIRTGSDYFCGVSIGLPTDGYTTQDCSGESGFSFNEGGVSLTEQSSSRRVAYRLHNNVLERRLGNGNGGGSVNEPSDWLPVTAPEIVITDLRFYVTGSMRTNTESPTVTLYIAGTAGEDDGSQSRFNIQTTIVQQLLDI